MVVQVWAVAPPPAGQDWTFKVPGQFLPYLYGVTATLGTTQHVTTIPDESGNGHTGSVQAANGAYVIETSGPYAGGADNRAVFGPDTFSGFNAAYVASAAAVLFPAATFTMDGWVNLRTLASGGFNAIAAIDNGGGGNITGLDSSPLSTVPAPASIDYSHAIQFSRPNWISKDTWHHVAVTWDGVQWVFYADGSAVITVVGGAPPIVAGTSYKVTAGGTSASALHGAAAGWAWYGAALGAGLISGHAAAGSSWANYKAAVNADAPLVFYGLNTIPTLANRIATLQVTDGTFVVAQFPANFAAATASGFIWSWQVGGPGAAASTDGITNSVPIPELRVDPGYTVGVKTLDLQSTDQWGPITLWFDDGTGPGGPGGPGGLGNVGYLDGTLTPQYGRA